MTIPFYTKNIIQPLQQMLYDADANGDWQPVIDYCEPLIENTEDDGVILCYTFALMEQALEIHIDDVEETANKCLQLQKRIKETTGGTDHWVRMLKRIIKDAKQLKSKENELLKKPYEQLTTSEKSKLAYNLAAKGSVENNKKAAEVHKDLIEIHKGGDDESYHYGNYVSCLYQSNQIELANEKFDELLTWTSYNKWRHYAFVISNCFQERIMHYLDDAKMMQQIWDSAMQHEAIKENLAFPYADVIQDKIIIAANELGLKKIVAYLAKLITAERKPRMIPQEVKNIIDINNV